MHGFRAVLKVLFLGFVSTCGSSPSLEHKAEVGSKPSAARWPRAAALTQTQKAGRAARGYRGDGGEEEDEAADESPEPEDAAPPSDAAASAAQSAKSAADTAKQAAKVAAKVAVHSVVVAEHAQSALRYARDVLKDTRAHTDGLSDEQEASLKKAEDKLKSATKKVDYGSITGGGGEESGGKVSSAEKDHLEVKLEKAKDGIADAKQKRSELQTMREELKSMREQLGKSKKATGEDSKKLQEEIQDLEKLLDKLKAEEERRGASNADTHDLLKSEVERLREAIKDVEDKPEEPMVSSEIRYEMPERKRSPRVVPLRELEKGNEADESSAEPMSKKPRRGRKSDVPLHMPTDIDIDTAMPYGDLEPFGREDTAQELTEGSVRESNAMVDSLERAEVSEEKRAVFRALTRLRGAAITSFDGVARSQTGNIDEYNKVNKWRNAHPLHHLADEESDVSKWAFPDNADM